ncbi:hypothetical protein [Flavobacterium humidisoli]|uniref:Outer membrane protein beta-barrel domain-containing protein n=1 Tax=Flavobacterium humidisoli TaxID=2937442 RepID=A0ABY4LYL0_9FLAO|nr:hypothetical protein [Flavobacterium humidisoli]UPZ17902.1 hypothetical protein M0M44_11250 [Flavobacterium humidisoli]
MKIEYAMLIAILSFSSVQLMAQDFPVKQRWSYYGEPYVMLPNISGKTAIGNLSEMYVDADPHQIFDNLKLGVMLYFEASNGKWNLNSDLLYMNVGKGVKSSTLISNGEVSAKQLGWELAGLYKIRPWLEVGVGGLLNSIKVGLDINRNNISGGTANIKKETSEIWFDPMLIAVFKNTPDKGFIYSARAEIGGFGLGSQFALQLQAYAGYRFSKLLQIQGGYRLISLDYRTGSGSDYFLYNMDTYGPVIKFGFHF